MTKQEILKWFNDVCGGIRGEYEKGASYRKPEVDSQTLSEMLDSYLENTKCWNCFTPRGKKNK